MPRPTADEILADLDLAGTVVLVTGATTGIGLETARSLAAAGATVHVGARTDAKAQAAMAHIRATHPDADLHPFVADLADLTQVRAGAAGFTAPALHVLIANAGVFGGGYRESAQGIEATYAICHLAHFVLADLLMPKLRVAAAETGEARVVMVASGSHLSLIHI